VWFYGVALSVPKLLYDPLEKQAQFHASSAAYRTYEGGFGSGKTLCGAAESIMLSCGKASNLGLVGRATYPELRDTTRKELLDFPVEIEGKEMALIASPLIRSFNKAENLLTFYNNSQILFRSLEDSFDKVKSLNLGWFWVDEGSEITREMWLGLVGRLRRKGFRHTGFITTNPEGRDWIWQDFWARPTAEHFAVTSTSYDNTHLPEGYVDGLKRQYPPEWIKRYVYGSRESFEGLIYKDFKDSPPQVVEELEIPKGWYRFIGLDHGYRNPTCVLWGAVDYDGNLYIYDELYASGMLVSEIATAIKTKNHNQKIQQFLIDPSCKNRNGVTGRSVMDEFSDSGLYFVPANNDVRAGINHVQEYLKINNGKSKLRIFRKCENLRTELQTYRWKDLRPTSKQDAPEKPLKKADHCVDAARYMINFVYDTPELQAEKKDYMKDYGVLSTDFEFYDRNAWMGA
jgi:PBSX family phage terminase large subunit